MHDAVDTILPTGPRLAGRKILITGAASGMGRAIAELFAHEGAATALLDVQEGPLNDIAGRTGGTAIKVDLLSETDVVAAVHAAEKALGGLDGVVNAAGILRTLPLADTSPDIWRQIHTINLFAPYLIANTALPALRRSGAATIVNIASMGGIETPPMMASYGASKAGLIGLTKGQATEWSPVIRANAICPGSIKTAMTDAIPGYNTPEQIERRRVTIGMERQGTSLEIAYLALFLTSRESGFVNGSIYEINGGRTYAGKA
ncbi:SDR family NAD(P)-dependent oxidoreductase [Sphingomonas montanisoli]|uniref:SDR family oxidoreductase n=1 Tax=Sphingomonas montanisoli TaxID=2606412 RepID=A0A5D9C7P8_9SPHN|nr:SDR family oxidoreductase [Sphingomonas montanisoli]TZG26031.1 SDR family oxidoreductase [Sphingomonas montanisoli]